MKIDVYGLDGNKLRSINLPKQFDDNYEENLVNRAVLVINSNNRQPYGTMQRAGMGYSAKLSRRRRDYKGAYGKKLSRVPRKTMWRRGMQFGWVGAFIPGAVGGRRAHPPKSFKIWSLKINEKERKKAIRSALSGVASKAKLIILENGFESLKLTKDVKRVLKVINLDVNGVRRKITGRGKSRGRKIRYKKNALVVVSGKCNLIKAMSNMPGYDVAEIRNINVALLSLGYGRLRDCIFTEGALDVLNKGGLFFNKK